MQWFRKHTFYAYRLFICTLIMINVFLCRHHIQISPKKLHSSDFRRLIIDWPGPVPNSFSLCNYVEWPPFSWSSPFSFLFLMKPVILLLYSTLTLVPWPPAYLDPLPKPEFISCVFPTAHNHTWVRHLLLKLETQCKGWLMPWCRPW